MFSVVIPVYRNEGSIPALLDTLENLNRKMGGNFEAVIVVDGSPDHSLDLLAAGLDKGGFSSQLLVLSRNFGSFAAIVAGLAYARGSYFGVMSADLQEPPDLILEFREKLLSGKYDVVVATRSMRNDSLGKRASSAIFWACYRAFVQREIPPGGVDVFACTREFRNLLLSLHERNTTLVGLIFWLGFRRGEISYVRRPRQHGKSAWSFARRLRYMLDSTFAFSDLPVRLMSLIGILGITLSVVLSAGVLIAKVTYRIPVPGYAATVLMIMFFGGLHSLGIGLIGEYVWRTFENTKGRPGYLVARQQCFEANGGPHEQKNPHG